MVCEYSRKCLGKGDEIRSGSLQHDPVPRVPLPPLISLSLKLDARA